MSKNNDDCQCPFCKQSFTPDSGMSPEEHIASKIIGVFGEIQKEKLQYELPCPRCGRQSMNPIIMQNLLLS